MRGTPYEKWELESAILNSRAETLRLLAGESKMPLDVADRTRLLFIADKLDAEAREVVRRG